MKKFILLFCFLILASPKIFSQIYIENFDYVAGTLLTTNDAWGATSGGGVIPITVTAPGLVFPNYAGSGIGNAVAVTVPTSGATSGEDDTARFTSLCDTTGSVYVSFMVRVDSARTGDYFFALLNPSGATTTFVGRVFAKGNNDTVAFGLSKNGGTADSYTPSTYSNDTTYLLILKYTFVAGPTNDVVSLYVFRPTDIVPVTEPGTPTLGPFPVIPGGTDLANVGKVLLRQGAPVSSASVKVDGIYANCTWNNSVLPVELTSFTSAVNGRDVTLNWSTATETNNSGFAIERLASRSGSSDGVWSEVGSVNGNGTSTIQHNYSFTDRELASGNYNYRLKQIDYNGAIEYFNLNNEVVIGLPVSFSVSQNYPNPFNPSTTIDFQIPADGNITVKVFDMSGKEVAALLNEFKAAGYYSISFNASAFSSGTYFYTITSESNGNSFTATKKMVLMK